MTCAFALIIGCALSGIGGLALGRWLRSITQLRMPASNSTNAADRALIEHEEFPINSGA